MGHLRPPLKRWVSKLCIVDLPKDMIDRLGTCLVIEQESLILHCSRHEFLGKKWPGVLRAILVVTLEPRQKPREYTGYPNRGCAFEWRYLFGVKSKYLTRYLMYKKMLL